MTETLQGGLRAARAFGLAILALAALGVSDASAQTPEGTEITNTSTVTFTDANGNAYDPVEGSAVITVGFVGGLDVTVGGEPHQPAAGSAAVIPFTIANTGNGTDQVQVTVAITGDANVLTAVQYRIGATTYANVGALNTALASTDITAGGNVVVEILYTAGAASGGLAATVELTATSQRDGTVTDTEATQVSPPISGDLLVAIDEGASATAVDRLPSGGTQYTATYTVENQQTGDDTVDLEATIEDGSVLTIISVNGSAGTTSADVAINAGQTATIEVVYEVKDVAAGLNEVLTLTATSDATSTTGSATHTVTVIRPNLVITKTAHVSQGGAEIDPENADDNVTPGSTIWYRIVVTNDGTAPADGVEVEDALPAGLTYVSTAADGDWSIVVNTNTVTATLNLTGDDILAVSGSASFWIEATLNDS